jgi:phage shock protein PspC (stress-responsive transcriptional regulator)
MTETTVPPVQDTPPIEAPSYRRLLRSRTNRQLTGVCGGIADYAGVDATVVRVGVVIATLFTGGVVALAYVLAAVLIPER